jgi:hypothetical protein
VKLRTERRRALAEAAVVDLTGDDDADDVDAGDAAAEEEARRDRDLTARLLDFLPPYECSDSSDDEEEGGGGQGGPGGLGLRIVNVFSLAC